MVWRKGKGVHRYMPIFQALASLNCVALLAPRNTYARKPRSGGTDGMKPEALDQKSDRADRPLLLIVTHPSGRFEEGAMRAKGAKLCGAARPSPMARPPPPSFFPKSWP